MKYRPLGKTGLLLSEIGFGAEWMERHNRTEVESVVAACEEQGINVFDCWMSEPQVRSNLGYAIAGRRDKWHIQAHIGSTWQGGQYVRSRDLKDVVPAFEDNLTRMQTDYIDIGVIHYVDEIRDFNRIADGPFMEYVRRLKESGTIRCVGMSTHNPLIGKLAVESGLVDMIMFSINPAFDMRPPSEDINEQFKAQYESHLAGIAPERAELYKLCETKGVGITVMKPFAGGRLFDRNLSPFGVALTPVQCLHYALTRPGVTSVMAGLETPEQVLAAAAYETATAREKNYASVLARAPMHAYRGQCTYCGHCSPCPEGIDIAMVNKLYDLATMTDVPSAAVVEHYRTLVANAGDCIGCGGCEPRCPFGVNVVYRMALAKKRFK